MVRPPLDQALAPANADTLWLASRSTHARSPVQARAAPAATPPALAALQLSDPMTAYYSPTLATPGSTAAPSLPLTAPHWAPARLHAAMKSAHPDARSIPH